MHCANVPKMIVFSLEYAAVPLLRTIFSRFASWLVPQSSLQSNITNKHCGLDFITISTYQPMNQFETVCLLQTGQPHLRFVSKDTQVNESITADFFS